MPNLEVHIAIAEKQKGRAIVRGILKYIEICSILGKYVIFIGYWQYIAMMILVIQYIAIYIANALQ